MKEASTQFKILVPLLVLLVCFPLFLPQYWMHILIITLWYVYICVAWNLNAGYAGMVSFVHTLFLGATAYSSTILFDHFGISPWIGMLPGSAIAVAVGLFLGFIDYHFRLPHIAFALISMGIIEIAIISAESMEITGGIYGLNAFGHGDAWWNYQFRSKVPFYYIILAMLIMILAITAWLERSKLGINCMAMRDNDRSAQASGVNLLKSKLLIMGLTAFLTSLVGTFYAQYIGFIDPHAPLGTITMIEVILFTMVGGRGSLWGPVVGAMFLAPLGLTISRFLPTNLAPLNQFVYGSIVVVVILTMPRGIWGKITSTFRSRKAV